MIHLPAIEPTMLWLFGGVLALLLIASLVGFVLARRVTSSLLLAGRGHRGGATGASRRGAA